MPTSDFGDALMPKLAEARDLLASAIASRAPTSRIKDAIETRPVVSPQPGEYQADIAIPLAKAPEAGAYEYGSGIHDPKKPGTYVIAPKNASHLAFMWDKVNENSPTGRKFRGISSTTGKAIFTYVDHPGVAARPYIRPSIEEKKTQIRQMIGRAFVAEIKSRLGELFRVD